MNLKEKVVVITGATGGIGSELSKAFSQKGARLVLISRNEDKLKDLITKLDGSRHEYIIYDFRNQDNFEELIKELRDKADNIDVLINNAGIGVYKSLEEAEEKDWADSININATFPFLLTKKLLQILQKSEKGIILNVGSGMGRIPSAGRSVYCASKFALRGLSLSLSKEYKRTNIHFVLVTLGSTLTDFGPMTLKEKQEESLKGKAYFTPEWVAKKFVELIEKDEFEDEIELYPSEYTGKEWRAS